MAKQNNQMITVTFSLCGRIVRLADHERQTKIRNNFIFVHLNDPHRRVYPQSSQFPEGPLIAHHKTLLIFTIGRPGL